jgi:hypothetical protein
MLQTRDDKSEGQGLRVDTLTVAHYRDLRAIRDRPSFAISPSRRNLFKRLGLIVPGEPPRPPGLKLRPPKPREHVLTDQGNAALDAWLTGGGA